MDAPMDSTVANQLLLAARDGSPSAAESLLVEMTSYLLSVAEDRVPHDLKVKCAASDVVQESLWEAARVLPQFDGRDVHDLKRWLRRILLNNVRDAARRYRMTDRRKLAQEKHLSSIGPDKLCSTTPSPSACAIRREETIRLIEALETLPEDYRQVIVLRNFELLAFAEIGPRMQRSADAARFLWARAIESVRKKLRPCDG